MDLNNNKSYKKYMKSKFVQCFNRFYKERINLF